MVYEIGKEYTFENEDIESIIDIDSVKKLSETSFTAVFIKSEYDEVFDETWLTFKDNNGFYYSFIDN